MYEFTIAMKPTEIESLLEFYGSNTNDEDFKFNNSAISEVKSGSGLDFGVAEIVLLITGGDKLIRFGKFLLDWLKANKKKSIKLKYTKKGKSVEIEIAGDSTPQQIAEILKKYQL